MKRICILILTIYFAFILGNLNAQTIWKGPALTFSKENSADWTLEVNQDRITKNVWITRANSQGIFNIASEEYYANFFSPADTEWAYGTTADIGSLAFKNWESLSVSQPSILVNQNLVVHLITDDIYIDIKFTYWQKGGGGGGFTYERSTDQNLSTPEFESGNSVKIWPNPSSAFFKVSGLTEDQKYAIYSTMGATIQCGLISNNEPIDIRNLAKGLYILTLENGIGLRFLKD